MTLLGGARDGLRLTRRFAGRAQGNPRSREYRKPALEHRRLRKRRLRSLARRLPPDSRSRDASWFFSEELAPRPLSCPVTETQR